MERYHSLLGRIFYKSLTSNEFFNMRKKSSKRNSKNRMSNTNQALPYKYLFREWEIVCKMSNINLSIKKIEISAFTFSYDVFGRINFRAIADDKAVKIFDSFDKKFKFLQNIYPLNYLIVTEKVGL